MCGIILQFLPAYRNWIGLLELNIVNKTDVNFNLIGGMSLGVRLLTGGGLGECIFVPGMWKNSTRL